MFVSPASSSNSINSSLPDSPTKTATASSPFFGRGSSAMHQRLMELGIVDEVGNVSPQFKETHALPPLNSEELQDLHNLRNISLDFKVPDGKTGEDVLIRLTLKEVLQHFKIAHPDVYVTLRLKGGGARFQLGSRYWCRGLNHFGVTNAEALLDPSRKKELDTPPPDRDFTLHVSESRGVIFNCVFEHYLVKMLKRKAKEVIPPERRASLDAAIRVNAFSKPSRLIETKDNLSLSLSLGNIDLIVYHKLRTDYLSSHQAIEIPCDFLLEDTIPADISIAPTSQSIDPLQAFFDCLLQRVNPHESIDDRGWIRIMHDLKKGFQIRDPRVWSQLKDYAFINFRKLTLSELLKSYIEDCENAHPTGHNAGMFFSALNACLFLGNRLSTEDTNMLWNTLSPDPVSNDSILNRGLLQLHQLLCTSSDRNSQRAPLALLELCALIRELLTPQENSDSNLTAKLVTAAGSPSFQLGFKTENGAHLYVQMMSSPVQAYADLLANSHLLGENPVFMELISNMLLDASLELNANSTITKQTQLVGIDFKTLLEAIKEQAVNRRPFFRLLSFYLAAAIHAAEPSESSELLFLELIPGALSSAPTPTIRARILETSKNLLRRCYSDALDAINTSENRSEIVSIVSAFMKKATPFYIKKLTQLLQEFGQSLPPQLFEQVTKRLLDKIPNDETVQKLNLINDAMKKGIPLDGHLFKAYCQTVYHRLHHPINPPMAQQSLFFGQLLLAFCKAPIDDLQPTPIRLEMTPWVIQNLFDDGYYALAHEILTLSAPGTNFHKLFGATWGSLARHSTEFASFGRLKEQFRQMISKGNIDGARKTFISILRECPNYSKGADLIELLQQLWTCIEDQLKKPTGEILFLVKAIPFIHDPDIRKSFPEFCLEQHIELLKKIPMLTCQIRPDTILDFLIVSLREFSPNVKPDQHSLYSARVIDFIRFATPALMQQKDPVAKRLIKEHSPCILKGAANDGNLLISHLLQMNIILDLKEFRANSEFDPEMRQLLMAAIFQTFGDKTKKVTPPEYYAGPSTSSFIAPASFAQDNQGVPLSDNHLKTLLIMARKIHEFKSTALTPAIMIVFCNESYRLDQIDNGNYWLDRLIEIFHRSSPQEQKRILKSFPSSLTALHKGKHFNKLMVFIEIYLKLNGAAWTLPPLFTEAFVSSQHAALLPFFLNHSIQMLFSTDPESINNVVLWLLDALLLEKSIKLPQKRQFLDLLSNGQIAKAEIWQKAFQHLFKTCTDAFHDHAFEVLRAAIKNGLLHNDDGCRVACWEEALKRKKKLPPELVLEWLNDKSELLYIYRNRSGRVAGPFLGRIFNLLESHFKEAALPLSPENTRVIFENSLQLRALFPLYPPRNFWAIELATLELVRFSIPTELFDEKLQNVINSMRSETTEQLQNSETEISSYREYLSVHLTSLCRRFGTIRTRLVFDILKEESVVTVLGQEHHDLMSVFFAQCLEKAVQAAEGKITPIDDNTVTLRSIIDLFLPYIANQNQPNQTQFSGLAYKYIIQKLKESEDIESTKELLKMIYSLTPPENNSQEIVYRNIARLLKKISSEKMSHRVDAQVILSFHIIYDLLIECGDSNFSHVNILVEILKEFIFNPKDLPETMNSHRKCADKLMSCFNSFFLQYVKVRQSNDLGVGEDVNYLRGTHSFYKHLLYISEHPNPFTAWRFLETVYSNLDRVFYSLTPTQLSSILNTFLERYMIHFPNLKKDFPIPPYADLYLIKKLEEYRLQSNELHLSVGSYFLLRPFILKCVNTESVNHLRLGVSCSKYHFNVMLNDAKHSKCIREKSALLHAAADIIRDLADNRVFIDDPKGFTESCIAISNALPTTTDIISTCLTVSVGLTLFQNSRDAKLIPFNEEQLKNIIFLEDEWVRKSFKKFNELKKNTPDLNHVITFWRVWSEKNPPHPYVQEFLSNYTDPAPCSSQDFTT